jgi:hypothetical protein
VLTCDMATSGTSMLVASVICHMILCGGLRAAALGWPESSGSLSEMTTTSSALHFVVGWAK